MTESIPPQPWAALNGGGTSAAGGGQDFVLFDDTAASAAMAAAALPVSHPYAQQQPQPFAAVTPNNHNNATESRSGAFTEYRNSAQPRGAPSGTGSLNESPFSSPASRPSDDLPTGSNGAAGNAWQTGAAAIPITMPQEPGSGTLSKGAPRSKRARAHGYSSSWTGGSLEKYMQQLQQASGQGQNAGIGSVGMLPTTSFGGFPTATSGSEWSGSDTSPRNPPSGSFGPPIHSLSLGDNGSPDMASFGNGQQGSLFPTTAADQEAMQAAMEASGSGVFTSFQTSMQQQQEDRARQQIRADLMGVDSRALKGQLRDIQQGSTSTSFPSFDTMAMQSDILFPNVPHTPMSGEMVSPSGGLFDASGAQDGGGVPALTQASTSMTSAPPPNHTTAVQQSQPPVDPAPQPTRQLSERTQQAVNRARAQKPTRKRMARDYSSTTVSPQEAFLDFQDVDSALRSSRPADAAPNVFASNTVTASIPALNNMAKSSSLVGMMAPALGGMTTPRATTTTDTMTHEGTPSLIEGGSSGSNSRATSSIPSPSQRVPLNRGETVRPTKAQQEAAASAASLSSSQRGSNTAFAQTDLGMLSPADSMTNSTDDEDERPYAPNRHMVDAPNAVLSSSSADGLRQSAGPMFGPHQGSGSGGGGGPRFSVVSSSSSESEDDDQKRSGNRKASSSQAVHAANPRPRTMGGYGYMGSSEESGLTASTPSAPPPSQQMTSLGLQAMPGSGAPVGMLGMPALYGTQVPTLFMPPHLDTAAAQNAANQPFEQRQPSSNDAPSETGSQSQDEGPRISPSIRSSAQAIYPMQGGNGQAMLPNMFGMQPSGVPGQQRMPFNQPNAAFAAQYASNQASQARARAASQDASSTSIGAARRGKARGPSAKAAGRKKNADDDDEESEEEDESSDQGDASADESEGSAYQSTAATPAPKTAKPRKSGVGSTAAQRRRSLAEASGDSANSGGASTLTRCDYVHPLTGEECETEFHRPYDLARHRETIHAREESSLLKAGKITREQCIVLYKEVDPAKSLATVEWRCDGETGCGALFSRKDALLRHRRIRNH